MLHKVNWVDISENCHYDPFFFGVRELSYGYVFEEPPKIFSKKVYKGPY